VVVALPEPVVQVVVVELAVQVVAVELVLPVVVQVVLPVVVPVVVQVVVPPVERELVLLVVVQGGSERGRLPRLGAVLRHHPLSIGFRGAALEAKRRNH